MNAFLAQAGVFVALATAWLYFIGWAYAFYYYTTYKLSLLSITIPERFFIIYGIYVLKDEWVWVLITGTFLLVITLVCSRTKYFNAIVPCLAILFTVAFGLSADLLAQRKAFAEYQLDLSQRWPSRPRVKISFKPLDPALEIGAYISELTHSGCWVALLDTESQLIVLRPTGPLMSPPILTIERAVIAGVQYWQPGASPCGT